jgi:hypothetical protein
VLQVILYIPVFSCSDVWFDVSGFKSCCSVVVVLNAMPGVGVLENYCFWLFIVLLPILFVLCPDPMVESAFYIYEI